MKAITFILFLTAVSLSLNAVQFVSLYSDQKSFTKGDVITILIVESTTATVSANSETDRSQDHGFGTQEGQGPLDFVPMSSFSFSSKNKAKGDATTARTGALKGKMTAKIVDIDPNGNLMIKGSRTVIVNGEEEITELQGVVRSQDVQSDNSVYSYNIADAIISYKGKGEVNTGARVGFITRVINWIF